MASNDLVVLRPAYARTVYTADFETLDGADTWAAENAATVTAPGDYLIISSVTGNDNSHQARRAVPTLVEGREYTFTAIVSSPDADVTVGLDATGADGLTPVLVGEEPTTLVFDFNTTVRSANIYFTRGVIETNSVVHVHSIAFVEHVPQVLGPKPKGVSGIAPEYRYFMTDLLTNEIIAEVPFRGVTWERAVKGAGTFSGRIPVIAATKSLDLYNTTMPGQTGLYVVRNGKCVWGGIIWARQYQFGSKDLSISASEFESYFYHRLIWKTWTHEYGATVSYIPSENSWRVVLENGSHVAVKPGSTVHFILYEVENFKYNGQYRVLDSPAPTNQEFRVLGGFAVADMVSRETRDGYTYVYTAENHGYSTGDTITIRETGLGGTPVTPTESTVIVEVPGGAESNMFRFPTLDGDELSVPVDGETMRPLPKGTYTGVTVTVRQDTYDYINSLLESMNIDFIGTDFPNIYIEPGVTYGLDVIGKEAGGGVVTLETATQHGLAPGQAIQIQNVDPTMDGEYEIYSVPTSNLLQYKGGGTTPATVVSASEREITSLGMAAGLASVTFGSAHGFLVGQTIVIDAGPVYSGFSGTFTITAVPTPTTIQYATVGTTSISDTAQTLATAQVAGDPVNYVSQAQLISNVATLTLEDPITFSPGDSVTVANTAKSLGIIEKALDAPNSKATIQTAENHGLTAGRTVNITGLLDFSEVLTRDTTSTTVTLTTSRPHNFRAGNIINVSGTETHRIVTKALTSNLATLTTNKNHNISVGMTINVSGVYDQYPITGYSISDGVATVNITGAHNFQVNDEISIAGVFEQRTVVSAFAQGGRATLTMHKPHNFQVGQKVTISSVGAPFDGQVELEEVTSTRITYSIDAKYWDDQIAAAARAGWSLKVPVSVPDRIATGTVKVDEGHITGTYTVTARTGSTVSYTRAGEDVNQTSTGFSGDSVIKGQGIFNGEHVVSARTGSTVTFPLVAANVSSSPVQQPIAEEDETTPDINLVSVNTGARTVTKVTPTSVEFNQSMPGSAEGQIVNMAISRPSMFNGLRTVTGTPATDRFTFAMEGNASMIETTANTPAYAHVTNLYNGTYTITAVDPVLNTFSYAKVNPNVSAHPVQSRGYGSVIPLVLVSSFGPYPGNADLDIGYSQRGFTGINVEPVPYRGFQLVSVGDALDQYSENINGFEYRIDCAYDEENDRFTRTFVFIPIQYPDPPSEGQVSAVSRFGAERLIFEYPGGNISDVSIDESAESSATRFFAVGQNNSGSDVGPNIGIASAQDMLRGEGNGRAWPILDASEKVDGVDDENVLYSYAQRYLSEAEPPYAKFNVTLNGSIAPFVDTYLPGDWCVLNLRDDFAAMRLASGLERRTDVFLRKIDSFKVSVPDGVTAPETVVMTLVAEWGVDTVGK